MRIETTGIERGVMSGFFQSFPFEFPLLFFYPFLSLLLLTNQVPMISMKRGASTVFILSLISEDICCISRTWLQLMCYTLSRSHCPYFKETELWSMKLIPESIQS